MNYSDDFKFKNYFSSRNRSLTKDQQLILELYQEKISIESFFELEKLNDFNFKGKIAIIRVDFNVPLDKNLRITDSTRIDLGIKSIEHVISYGGKCIIMSHLGRPKGNGFEKDYSLKNILKYLNKKIFRQKM